MNKGRRCWTQVPAFEPTVQCGGLLVVNIDELLRTEFTSRQQALHAAGGYDTVMVPETMLPSVKVQDEELWKWNEPPINVPYTMRQAVLREFEFSWGVRWKFCLKD